MKRLTFPHIATERHPHATGRRVALSLRTGLLKPGKKDIEIAREILAVHSELRDVSDATGEWKWVNDNKRSNYLSVLDRENAMDLARCLVNMFRNDAAYGIISSDFSRVKTKEGQLELENQILLDLDTLNEFDENDHSGIEWGPRKHRCGNPYGYLTRKGRIIAVDTARHYYYANTIATLLKDTEITSPTIFEIGGGYGGLCTELFHHASFSKLKYIDCDLPETLYLCYFFLKKMLPSYVRIGWAIKKMPDSDIVLVPAHKKDLVKHADIIFNAQSLSEMSKQTVDEYMTLLHRVRPKYFLHQNSNFVLFPNSVRHIEITASEFAIKNSLYKKIYAAISPWQGEGGRSRDYLYVRRET